MHSDVKRRWLDGDAEVREKMELIASCAEEGRWANSEGMRRCMRQRCCFAGPRVGVWPPGSCLRRARHVSSQASVRQLGAAPFPPHRLALETGNLAAFAALMDRNFDLRRCVGGGGPQRCARAGRGAAALERKCGGQRPGGGREKDTRPLAYPSALPLPPRELYGDAALGAANLAMVQTARSVGAAAKFTGSGGAVVAFCPMGEGQEGLLQGAPAAGACWRREGGPGSRG